MRGELVSAFRKGWSQSRAVVKDLKGHPSYSYKLLKPASWSEFIKLLNFRHIKRVHVQRCHPLYGQNESPNSTISRKEPLVDRSILMQYDIYELVTNVNVDEYKYERTKHHPLAMHMKPSPKIYSICNAKLSFSLKVENLPSDGRVGIRI
jgi:hypothetical protein